MKHKLYVIGNGFDIHHGIECSYNNFFDYCKKNETNLCLDIEKYYYDSNMLWSNFEEELINIDPSYILDDSRILLPNWNSCYKEMYQFIDGVSDEVDKLKYSLTDAFNKWVKNLNKGNLRKKLAIDAKHSLFISFNYTDTLEDLYKVSNDSILYIHGKANHQNSDLLFGHGANKDQISELISTDNILEADALETVGDFLFALRKDTGYIINENQSFFSKLKDIDEIYVLGSSLSDVDLPYFKKIKQSTQSNSKWFISYYKDKENEKTDKAIVKIKSAMEKLEIDKSNFNLFELSKIDELFLPKIFNE